MKKRICAAVAMICVMIGVSACSRVDSGSSASTGNVAVEENGSVTSGGTYDTTVAGGTGYNASASDNSDNQNSASGFDGQYSGDVTDEDQGEDEMAGYGTSNQPSGENEDVPEMNYTDEDLDGIGEADGPDDVDVAEEEELGWSGTYSNEEMEVLTINIQDADHISFAFANAGLSGTAELDGSQAIFHGDDQHVIVFTYGNNSVTTVVLSEEDYDEAASPLNGIFVREE